MPFCDKLNVEISLFNADQRLVASFLPPNVFIASNPRIESTRNPNFSLLFEVMRLINLCDIFWETTPTISEMIKNEKYTKATGPATM